MEFFNTKCYKSTSAPGSQKRDKEHWERFKVFTLQNLSISKRQLKMKGGIFTLTGNTDQPRKNILGTGVQSDKNRKNIRAGSYREKEVHVSLMSVFFNRMTLCFTIIILFLIENNFIQCILIILSLLTTFLRSSPPPNPPKSTPFLFLSLENRCLQK